MGIPAYLSERQVDTDLDENVTLVSPLKPTDERI
jgi:hypothetical protein